MCVVAESAQSGGEGVEGEKSSLGFPGAQPAPAHEYCPPSGRSATFTHAGGKHLLLLQLTAGVEVHRGSTSLRKATRYSDIAIRNRGLQLKMNRAILFM